MSTADFTTGRTAQCSGTRTTQIPSPDAAHSCVRAQAYICARTCQQKGPKKKLHERYHVCIPVRVSVLRGAQVAVDRVARRKHVKRAVPVFNAKRDVRACKADTITTLPERSFRMLMDKPRSREVFFRTL